MKGRGFWKLNTSFLKDEEYIKKIQSIITQTKDEYAQDNTITPNLLWETINMKIRETSIEFGGINKRKLFQKTRWYRENNKNPRGADQHWCQKTVQMYSQS